MPNRIQALMEDIQNTKVLIPSINCCLNKIFFVTKIKACNTFDTPLYVRNNKKSIGALERIENEKYSTLIIVNCCYTF